MIVQRINDTTQVIFTYNKSSDLNSIGSELGYMKKDGGFYKSVNINTSSEYRLNGSDISLPAIQLNYKGVTTYIINKSYEFGINPNNLASIIENIKVFGASYKLKLKDMKLSQLSTDGSNLISDDGTSLTFNNSPAPDTTNINNFIHRMSMDNGRMLQPVIKRFINTLMKFNGHKSTLTGYVNLKNYLYTIKVPTKNIFNVANDKSSNYKISLNSGITTLEVTDVNNGIPEIQLNINGTIGSNINTGKFEPYILFTSTPIHIKTQKMPYQIVNYRGVPIFITPLLFNNQETLNTLRGGINLLS